VKRIPAVNLLNLDTASKIYEPELSVKKYCVVILLLISGYKILFLQVFHTVIKCICVNVTVLPDCSNDKIQGLISWCPAHVHLIVQNIFGARNRQQNSVKLFQAGSCVRWSQSTNISETDTHLPHQGSDFRQKLSWSVKCQLFWNN